MELLHSIDTVVLDKTGTITKGEPKVTDVITNIDEKELLKIAGSLESNSEHPLAKAIIEKTNKEKIQLISTKDFENISGRGIKGNIENVIYYAGNINFMTENNINTAEYIEKINKLQEEGKTVLCFANSENIIGIIAVADVIKKSSYKAIEELDKQKIEVFMITGDNKKVAKNIASKLNIKNVISEVLPQDKAKEVEKLQDNNKKVVFVGDGINDSPALAKADVGIAISSGTDIAIESADVVLMKNDLCDVVTAISLSKAVMKNIKMNLFWAFFYNIIGIPIAAGVFYLSYGLKLNPMIGATAMSFSSVCVVTNALRLRKFKSKFKEETNKMKKIKIEGMQCNHCKMSVEKALNSIENITKVEVDLEAKCASVEYIKEIDNQKIKNVIEEAGFTVISID